MGSNCDDLTCPQREQKQERPCHQTWARSAQHSPSCSTGLRSFSTKADFRSLFDRSGIHHFARRDFQKQMFSGRFTSSQPASIVPLGFLLVFVPTPAHQTDTRNVSTRVLAVACTMLGRTKCDVGAATKTRVEPHRTSQASSTPTQNQLCSHHLVESHECVRAAFGTTSQWIHSTHDCQQERTDLTQAVSNW